MPASTEYDKAYGKLNIAQKKAVDTIEGPVMVVAGPGTGKTQVLTLRIANILLRTDTQPENILALTFTEAGAYAMRKRLVEIMGPRAYKITITTFHSFCNDLIGNYPEHFPRIVGGLPITDADQVSVIEKILASGEFPLLRPFGDPAYYVMKIISAIQTLKREGVSSADFCRIVDEEEKRFAALPDLYHKKGPHKGKMKGEYKNIEKHIKKNKELSDVYTRYQDELFSIRRYDYDDMIVEAVMAIENDDDFRLMLQEEYQYILADEHQDTNNAQNRILELLADFHESPNLFIVGDEKQAIFRFQGAELNNFLFFQKKFPTAVLVSLVENYRSTQKILDAAHSLILNASGDVQLRKKLHAAAGRGEEITVAAFPNEESESLYIADAVSRLIAKGVPADEIAVLYRNNTDAFTLTRAFEKTDIPFTIVSEQHLLSDDDIAGLLFLLRAINEPGNNAALARILYLPYLSLKPLDAYKLTSYTYDRRVSLSDILDNSEFLREAGVSDIEAIRSLFRRLNQWVSLARNKSLLELLDVVTAKNESGFLSYILSEKGSLDRIEKFGQFMDIAKQLVLSHKRYQLADFLAYLDTLDAHHIFIKQRGRSLEHGVRLMTAHKSKGLEFDHVFLTGVTDGHWGGKRSVVHFRTTLVDSPLGGKEKGADDDERRLFYVALTRARKSVMITYPKENTEGKELHPSRFIDEIDPAHRHAVDTEKLIAALNADYVARYTPKKNFGPELSEREYLRKRFIEQGLSVSALNNYLECPWQYFFRNLVRVPEGQGTSALYGTAVHHALEAFFKKWTAEAADPGEEFLMERFHYFLDRQPLAEREYADMSAKGRNSLSGYYKRYHNEWNPNILCEFSISGIHLDVFHGDENIPLLLKGKLDKIEFVDGTEHVNVVDFKTAKPKSRNEIEGKTKSHDESYKRQLVFYKLLLDRYDDGKFMMDTGDIDFTEPDDKGVYHKERFAVTSDDVKLLEDEVIHVAQEILGFSFWDVRCQKGECLYCELRNILDKE